MHGHFEKGVQSILSKLPDDCEYNFDELTARIKNFSFSYVDDFLDEFNETLELYFGEKTLNEADKAKENSLTNRKEDKVIEQRPGKTTKSKSSEGSPKKTTESDLIDIFQSKNASNSERSQLVSSNESKGAKSPDKLHSNKKLIVSLKEFMHTHIHTIDLQLIMKYSRTTSSRKPSWKEGNGEESNSGIPDLFASATANATVDDLEMIRIEIEKYSLSKKSIGFNELMALIERRMNCSEILSSQASACDKD